MAPWWSKGWRPWCSATRSIPTRRRCWPRSPAASSRASTPRQPCSQAGAVRSVSLLGRFRLALLAQPKTLEKRGHGVAEAAILQLGIGQHRGARPALAAHLDCLALGAPADLVPRRVVEEIGKGLRKAAVLVDRKADAGNDQQAVHARRRRCKRRGQ